MAVAIALAALCVVVPVASIVDVMQARFGDVVVVLLEKDWVIRAKALAVTGW